MISEQLQDKLAWVKHWQTRGLTVPQALIAISQMLSPIPDGLDKNSSVV